ncbi:hypothetical protein [Saccharothrix hoggarensis]|uniref:Uncharacterized protein n=1 Tax=Saccharothrix hoggarensis TaxID=913853 RepID=A0ABW3QSK5_9PSEU
MAARRTPLAVTSVVLRSNGPATASADSGRVATGSRLTAHRPDRCAGAGLNRRVDDSSDRADRRLVRGVGPRSDRHAGDRLNRRAGDLSDRLARSGPGHGLAATNDHRRATGAATATATARHVLAVVGGSRVWGVEP